jgi:DNA repair protein RadC
VQQSTADYPPVYQREVLKRALLLNVSAVILVHNHLSGDPRASYDASEMTLMLCAVLDPLGIALHDQLAIGHGRHASFCSLGLR